MIDTMTVLIYRSVSVLIIYNIFYIWTDHFHTVRYNTNVAPVSFHSADYFSLSVSQVEHPAGWHDASLFPHCQCVFALCCNLPAHVHMWMLCVWRLAPGFHHGTPLRCAPRPHRGREYITHRLSQTVSENTTRMEFCAIWPLTCIKIINSQSLDFVTPIINLCLTSVYGIIMHMKYNVAMDSLWATTCLYLFTFCQIGTIKSLLN